MVTITPSTLRRDHFEGAAVVVQLAFARPTHAAARCASLAWLTCGRPRSFFFSRVSGGAKITQPV